MDIIAGITAATQAVQLVKELRAIDRSVDEASFKLKLAELTEALADTRIALSEARELIAGKEAEIRRLESALSTAVSGDNCPLCRVGRLSVTAVRPHPTFGAFGHQEHDLECSNEACRHRERRKVARPGSEHR